MIINTCMFFLYHPKHQLTDKIYFILLIQIDE